MNELNRFEYLKPFVLGIIVIVTFSFISCSTLLGTDSVKGTITDADTGEPIEGVLVTVESLYSSKQYTTTTDADGYYEINDIIMGGGLALQAEKEGYIAIYDSFDDGNHTKNYQMTKST